MQLHEFKKSSYYIRGKPILRRFALEAQGWIQLSSGPVKPTWDALERLFESQYCLLEERVIARHEMESAQMSNSKAGSLLAYTNKFRLNMIKVNSGLPPGQGVSEGIAITEYSRSLCSPFKEMYVQWQVARVRDPRPVTLDEVAEVMLKGEATLTSMEQLTKLNQVSAAVPNHSQTQARRWSPQESRQSAPSGGANQSRPSQGPKQGRLAAMDGGYAGPDPNLPQNRGIRADGTVAPFKENPKWRAACKAVNACFACRQIHDSKDPTCPNRDNARQGKLDA